MSDAFFIGARRIGPGSPAFIIAELSGNHGGKIARALDLIAAAKEAGADAVKLQTYTADTITLRCDSDVFRIGHGTIWEGRQLHDLYTEASTPWEWHGELFAAAAELNLPCFSSPFDPTAIDFLETLQCPAYKIASFELVDLPLIRRAAATGKPIIMSTGMATLGEVREAVNAARSGRSTGLALLKCTSGYPAPLGDMNLRTIPALAQEFDLPVGLSDHTMGPIAPIAAVSLGASIIEKHLILDRADGGPDASFSLNANEFQEMVKTVRQTEAALGTVRFDPTPAEIPSRKFRRSLFVTKDMLEGEVFSAENIRSIRPSDGLAPKHLEKIMGSRATQPLARGTPLAWEHVEKL